MADTKREVSEALIKAAKELRKKAAEVRKIKPRVKKAGYSVDINALKELILNGK